MDVEFNSASKEYPQFILLMDPTTQKQEIPEKCDGGVTITFFQLCFWGSGVCQKYAVKKRDD